MPPRRRVVAAAALLGAGTLLGPASARGAAPDTTASRVPVTISAVSLGVDQLVYVDTVPVQTLGGPVPTLELDITGATFDGLSLSLPCVPIQLGGLTGRTTTTGTTTAAQLTVYATDVVATIGGTQVRLSSTNSAYPPPPAGTVLVTNATVVAPTMVAVLATSAELKAPTLAMSASFCTPGAAAKPLAGVPLSAVPTPRSPATSGAAEPAAPATTGPGGAGGQGELPGPPSGSPTSIPTAQPSGDSTTSATTTPPAPEPSAPSSPGGSPTP